MTMSGSLQIINVLELLSDNEDFHLEFMKSNGPARSFTWPKSKDQCWMSSSPIPMEVSNLTTETRRHYKLCNNEGDQIICFEKFLNTST